MFISLMNCARWVASCSPRIFKRSSLQTGSGNGKKHKDGLYLKSFFIFPACSQAKARWISLCNMAKSALSSDEKTVTSANTFEELTKEKAPVLLTLAIAMALSSFAVRDCASFGIGWFQAKQTFSTGGFVEPPILFDLLFEAQVCHGAV